MGSAGLMFFEWLLLIESAILGTAALFAIGLICDPAAKVWLAERLAASARRQIAASQAAAAMKRAIAAREREPLPGTLGERERRHLCESRPRSARAT